MKKTFRILLIFAYSQLRPRPRSLTPCPLPWQGRGSRAGRKRTHAGKLLAVAVLAVLLSGTLTAASAQENILVLAGLGNTAYVPAKLFTPALGMTPRYSYLANALTGFVLDQPFPKKLEGLRGLELIVLADVPASAFNGLMGRRALRQFVEIGQGLLVFGGPFALGKGELEDCAFEDALPVTTTGPWDLVKADNPVVKVGKPSPITNGLHWEQKPVISYYQKVIPKPGAEVLLKCGEAPLLVTGTYGEGRVAVFTGTYLEAAKGQTLIFDWPDYATMLGRLTWWLTQR